MARRTIVTISRPGSVLGLLTLVVCLLPACSHWRDAYVEGAVGEATQQEVRERLGKPHIVETSLLQKTTTWVYRVALPEGELDPSGLRGLGAEVSELGSQVADLVKSGGGKSASRERIVCLRYELVFDEQQILRSWTRAPCRMKKKSPRLDVR